jgi:hypothetical protein
LVPSLTQRLNPADIVLIRLTAWEQEVLGLTPGDTTAIAVDTPVLSEEATASISVTKNFDQIRKVIQMTGVKKLRNTALIAAFLMVGTMNLTLHSTASVGRGSAVSVKNATVSPMGCTVSRKGRVTCTYKSYGPKVWNNGKSRGYYWPKR